MLSTPEMSPTFNCSIETNNAKGKLRNVCQMATVDYSLGILLSQILGFITGYGVYKLNLGIPKLMKFVYIHPCFFRS